MRFDDNMDDNRGVGAGGSANSSSDFVSPSRTMRDPRYDDLLTTR